VFDVTKGFLDLIFSIVEYLTIINWRLLWNLHMKPPRNPRWTV
jgi:hypothetical protein